MRFVASEWPGTPVEALEAWKNDALAHAKAHPDGPLGSVVDVLQAAVATRRRHWLFLYGQPHYSEESTS